MKKPIKPMSPAPRKAGQLALRRIPTGVSGLDAIVGGGIPEYSVNVIAGAPGCGKTTLAHQIVFANGTVKHPALYFTVLGEPTLKMLRYQQQYAFFEEAKLQGAVRFINLADVVMERDMNGVLEEITRQVVAFKPAVVVVDSFRTLARKAAAGGNDFAMQSFIQRLTQLLTCSAATTFLIGEYEREEMRDNPLFTAADGLLWMWQLVERNSVVRKLQVVKLRGQASVPGMHTIRIGNDGVQAFCRTVETAASPQPFARRKTLSLGVEELDRMMGGGIREGDSLLVAGPSGTGKSALATQFIAEGLRHGQGRDHRGLRGAAGRLRRARHGVWSGSGDAATLREAGDPLPASPRSVG